MKPLAAAFVLGLTLGSAVLAADVPQGLDTFDAVWRIVRDTHFDKTYNGVDWEAARTEFRPKAAEATTTSDLRRVIREMLGRLGQSHFALVPATADSTIKPGGDGSAHAGFDLRLVGSHVLVTGIQPGTGAATAGVQLGWRVTAVGDKTINDILKPAQEIDDERVRGLEAWRILQGYLRGGVGSTIDVTFEDGRGAVITRSVTRTQEQGQAVTVGTLPTMYVRVINQPKQTPRGRPVGLVGFNVWMAAVDAPFQRAIDQHRSSAGIVLDLRGNPGGLAAMMMGIAGHFVGDATPLGVMKTRDNELRFTVNPRRVSAEGKPVSTFQGPVAILVDGLSGSASECFTGGMQSLKRVRVFGQRSMGAALPSQFDRLPNGDVFIHATGDFVAADGTRLEGRGVIPDEAVPLTREDLLAGRDRVLDAALAWIDTEHARLGK